MQKINIINCDSTHIKDIARLEEGFDSERYSEELISKSLDSNETINLILECDGEYVAYLSAMIVLDECELLKIIVDKNYRRMGFGNKLIGALISRLKIDGFNKIFLEVRSDNIIAKNFYEKNGFEKITQRKKYYSDGVDADIYWLNLND